MKNKFSIFLLLVCSFSLLTYSCKKPQFGDLASTSWNPNLAVPLAYGTFDVYDIFANTNSNDLVIIDPNTGSIALVYRSDLSVVSGSEVLNLQGVNDAFALSATQMNASPTGSFNGTVNSNSQQDIVLSVGAGVELDNFVVKNGQLTINLSSNLAHDLTVNVTFPGITISGNAVQQTVQMNYTGSVPHTGIATINLANALVDCSYGVGYNTIPTNVQTTITGSGAAVAGGEMLTVEVSSNNLNFSQAHGYFGQQSLANLSDSVLLRLFENSPGMGYFEFSNPILRLFAENEVGLPVQLSIDEIKTINVQTAQEFPLTGFASIYNINFPSILGNTSFTTLVFNNANTSGLNTVLSPEPKYLSFILSAMMNPDGPTSTMNFVSDTSKLRFRSELELPLEGFAYGFGVRDTVPFNLSQNISEIEYVMFRLFLDNGFPIEMGGQVKFMDDNYNVLFSAFDQTTTIVPPALVDGSGMVNQRATNMTDIVLEDWKLDLLPQVKYLEIEGNTQTTDGPLGVVVKMFDWYNLKMKLSMQIQAKMKF
jgi:hypothetical protein